jgi:hypothetical protein
MKIFGAGVESVKVKSSVFGCVREDMFLERVVTKLSEAQKRSKSFAMVGVWLGYTPLLQLSNVPSRALPQIPPACDLCLRQFCAAIVRPPWHVATLANAWR